MPGMEGFSNAYTQPTILFLFFSVSVSFLLFLLAMDAQGKKVVRPPTDWGNLDPTICPVGLGRVKIQLTVSGLLGISEKRLPFMLLRSASLMLIRMIVFPDILLDFRFFFFWRFGFFWLLFSPCGAHPPKKKKTKTENAEKEEPKNKKKNAKRKADHLLALAPSSTSSAWGSFATARGF
jgi:hypothetical protein